MTRLAINRETISQTYNRIRSHVRVTPTLAISPHDIAGAFSELHLKLELLQHSGSFKARGAVAHFSLGDVPEAGVIAASGGNHGAAVAFAANAFNARARIFVPEISAPAKQQLIREYGAELIVGGAGYADALEASETAASETGAKVVHAYDQSETILGQGSVGLELEQQAPGLTTLLVAVGGGGLIGGIAAWYQGRIKLVSVEPETASTLKAALDANRPVDVDVSGLAADSLGARKIGQLAFPLCQSYVEESVTVTDGAIRNAQAVLWQKTRLIAEPGGVAALAALISGAYVPAENERVGVVICGANTNKFDFITDGASA